MAIKEIKYTVGLGSISPATAQKGGVQGDHGVTTLKFIIQEELYNALSTYKKEGRELIYHFDAVDGAGGQHYFAPAELNNRELAFVLEEPLTRYGGLVKVTLVVTVISDEKTELESFSFPAQLKFTFSPHSNTDKQGEYQSIATLAQVTKKNAKLAEEKATEAKEAQAATESAKAAFQGGAVYVFDGGDASGEIDIDFIIDDEMKDFSNNPVANGAVKKYIDDKFPIGSIWIGGKKDGEPIHPSTIFGGGWQLIDKQFRTARYYSADADELKKYFYNDDDRIGTNINVNTLHVEYCDHSIVFTVDAKTSTALNDTEIVLLRLDLHEGDIGSNNPWGVIKTKNSEGKYDNIIYPRVVLGTSDEGSTVGILRVSPDNGEIIVSCKDIVTSDGKKTEDGELKTNVDFHFTVTVDFFQKNMRNSFCNRFYWERIS